jgi:hypothetical protein
MGASVPDQALAVPVEPVSRLDPSGFDPSRMMELAAQCERASGPDRELDELIQVELQRSKWPNAAVFWLEGAPAAGVPSETGKGWGMLFCRRPYSHSLDAALTLLPGRDWEWSLEWESGSLLYHPDIEQFARAEVGDPMLRMEAECVTPALAMTAAALLARSHAIATEARRAETVKQGSVHEGAGLKGIAQPPSGDS